MPECNPRCPILKEQLRKLVTEAPWLLKECSTSSDREELVSSKDDRSDHRQKDAKAVVDSTTLIKKGKKAKGAATFRDSKDKSMTSSTTQWTDSAKGPDVQQISTSTQDSKSKLPGQIEVSKTIGTATMDEEKMDQATLQREDTDVTSIQTDFPSKIDSISGEDEADKTDQREKINKQTEMTMFGDECEPSCPQSISRRERMRKLEERQRIVDTYLLNKNAGFFDDICVCSLSCVVYAMRHNSFIISTLTSVLLFTLGLKLSSELDAWYLPI